MACSFPILIRHAAVIDAASPCVVLHPVLFLSVTLLVAWMPGWFVSVSVSVGADACAGVSVNLSLLLVRSKVLYHRQSTKLFVLTISMYVCIYVFACVYVCYFDVIRMTENNAFRCESSLREKQLGQFPLDTGTDKRTGARLKFKHRCSRYSTENLT